MNKKLVIYGCGGHAISIADVALFNQPDLDIVFVDNNAKDNEKKLNFPVIKEYVITNEKTIIGIGDNKKREEYSKKAKNLCALISKTAYVSKHTEIGQGVFIAHHAHVGIGSKIGDNVIINTSASVDHDCQIGANSHIAPNSTLCGKVKIGKNVFIGAGSTIIDNISICDDAIIGAGTVVCKNIDAPGTYFCKDGKKIK